MYLFLVFPTNIYDFFLVFLLNLALLCSYISLCVPCHKFEHYPTKIYITIQCLVHIIYDINTGILNDFLPFTLKIKIYLRNVLFQALLW
jgi:hypothetical protein